ncbi:cytochrome P450 [Lentithecium fluviatile CBS 122367]|uniref:Cytochrome P450 n=1 Tax=Lentithecium fluviatile CBS 122367 TaxID=1168545 RepID=A0A6G1ITK2_9PLEO|nr:cytochrome P450 [Lentithecium fluviatile CBS 122367]
MGISLDAGSIIRNVVRYCLRLFFYLFTAVIITSVCIFFIHKRERKRKLLLPGIPLVHSPKSSDFRTLLDQANGKDPTVIIPPHCIEELKNLPDSQLSTNGSMYDRFAIRWTNSGWVDKELAHSIKYDLANDVDDFFPTIQDEIQHASDNSLPISDSWSSHGLQEVLINIVGPVLGRMMVGSPLNRDTRWLSSSIDHAIAVVVYSTWLRQFPSIPRPMLAHISPQKRAIERSKKGISESIAPIIEERMKGNQKVKSSPFENGRLVRWLLKRYKPSQNPEFDPSLIFRDHYSLCFAAIHGPTFLLVQAIIDLASYPQYLTPLREEIDRELLNVPFEGWTRETVARMKLLDAFCKESARMNLQGIIGWLRKTHKPITLSTGHTIPPNTLVAAKNPRYNARATPWAENAEEFRPERWLQDQSDPSPNANWRFEAATIDSLIFGYGKHACSGRPFGVTMVKDILSYIVAKWDVRLAGGKREGPQNKSIDFVVMPPIEPLGDLKVDFKLRS